MEDDAKDLLKVLAILLIFIISIIVAYYFMQDPSTIKSNSKWEYIGDSLYRKRTYGGWFVWTLDTRCSPTFVNLKYPDNWVLDSK